MSPIRVALRSWAILALLGAGMLVGRTARSDDGDIAFFEAKIRPLLVAHCYECHGPDSTEIGGNLRLDSREAVLKGGDSGAALTPGKPETSLIVQAVRYADGAPHMPPTAKLPAAAIVDLEEWVARGAPDPRDAPASVPSPVRWESVLAARRDWWSLQPVVRPAVPAIAPGVAARTDVSPIDAFLYSRLNERAIAPASLADRRTLARRLYLTLTGLPPTLEQLADFDRECRAAGDDSPAGPPPLAAVERLVDALLGSPQFGERFARHWMDVVRFTETHGNEWNYEVHHAWRYRDYLIRAFHADLPYDRLVREHIAGDLLPPRWNASEGFNESPIGTAFFRFGEANHDDCIALRTLGFDLADNQIDTLSKAFQATTVACARCHDHKIDAVSMHDYYALLGVVRSSRLVAHTLDAPEVNAAPIARLKELKVAIRGELAAIWQADAPLVARYLLAAQARKGGDAARAAELAVGLDAARLEKWSQALADDKAPREDLFAPWRGATASDPAAFAARWQQLTAEFTAEDRVRTEFNRSQFTEYADFQTAHPAGWQVEGQGLRDAPAKSGEFAIHPAGDAVVQSVLPAGSFTHVVSEKLNGALRSPVLPTGKKFLSLQVMGRHGAALRLVSNNCQLNYRNYKSLISTDLQWVTFSPPEDCDALRTYVEATTMFDNPKFPDQLSALGGDSENYRLPWEEAARNPRSCFGITRAVWHDGPEPPRSELSHQRLLFDGPAVKAATELAERYQAAVQAAIEAWGRDQASPADVRWIDGLLRRELLSNATSASDRLSSLAAEYRRVEAELALPRVAPGVGESDPYDQPVFVRGDCQRPGEAVPRRYLEVLAGAAPFAVKGSGRLELAERLASPDNPLTARVAVNRLWHHAFGAGLVRTVDDFGRVGELPSHPELLDFLAAEFVDSGWSIKRMLRAMLLSEAFRRSSRPPDAVREIDPENRLLAHFSARRLEAEAIRDSILACSGRLDRTPFGPSVQPYREQEIVDRRLFKGPLDGHGRRSIYIKNNLMEAPKFLGAFNFPGGKVAQGRRDATNVPAQALTLLNDPFVWQQAEFWAKRLVARSSESTAARLSLMFETALGRAPRAEELARFERAAAELSTLHGAPVESLASSEPVWRELAHAFFNLQEFIYIP